MQTVQKKDLSWATVWEELVKLDFISRFFAWLMEFLARVTEPVAAFATIYIIIVAGVPAVMVSALYTFALMLIIGSPELLIVGALKIASRELAQGNKKAWWLMVSCFVLLALTALTVSDLFMWHWPPYAVNVLMGFRCLAGIGYTLARGICTDQSEPVNLRPGSPTHSLLTEFTQNIQQTVNQAVNQTNQTMLAEVNLIRQGLLTEVNQQHQRFVSEVHLTLQDLAQQQRYLHSTVNSIHQRVQEELQAAVESLGQQSQLALDTAVERLERANSRRMEAVYTRLEQVKVTLESNPALPTVNVGGSPLRLPSRTHTSVSRPIPGEPLQGRPVPSSSVHREQDLSEENQGSELEGLLEGTKVDQGRQFAVNYYRSYQVLPKLDQIMAAVGCKKTLASKARARAAQDLNIVTTTSED